jgi:N-acetyl sugar amidotransferase
MDESDPNITFDTDGFCNHCNNWYARAPSVIRPYHQLVEKVLDIRKQGAKRKYDLLLGASGGIDSSYAAYIAHHYDLKVLVAHFDNGYNTQEGNQNVQSLLDKTGWDYEYRTMDTDEFTDLQLAYLKSGVRNLESISDHAIKASVYDVAMKNDIKYILKGNNWDSEGILPRAWGYRHSDLTNIKDIHRQHGTRPLETYPMLGIIRFAYINKIKGFKEFRPLNYQGSEEFTILPYRIEKAKDVLQREWGWKDYGSKHGESIITRFYQNYILPTRWGFDKTKPHLSTLICSGQITRDEAVKILQEGVYSSEMRESDQTFILNRLGLTEEEFNSYMNLPRKEHTEYKTDDWTWNILRFGKRLIEG